MPEDALLADTSVNTSSRNALLARAFIRMLGAMAILMPLVSYLAARNSTGPGTDLIALHGGLLVCLPTLLLLLHLYRPRGLWDGLLLTLSWGRQDGSHSTFFIRLCCWMVMVSGSLSGALLGNWQRHREWERNRKQVEQVIARLETYRSRNGEYPARLEVVTDAHPVMLRFGCDAFPLKYDRISPREYELRYCSGWYVSLYHSSTGSWEERD